MDRKSRIAAATLMVVGLALGTTACFEDDGPRSQN